MITSTPIYTLEYLKKEAEGIAGSWNGKDRSFIYEGDVYPAEQADTALELLIKIEEVEELVKELSI